MIKTEATQVQTLAVKICNRCKKEVAKQDPLEWQEFLTIWFRGGYGSVWGDDNIVRIDLCQQCGYKLLKDFAEIEN